MKNKWLSGRLLVDERTAMWYIELRNTQNLTQINAKYNKRNGRAELLNFEIVLCLHITRRGVFVCG